MGIDEKLGKTYFENLPSRFEIDREDSTMFWNPVYTRPPKTDHNNIPYCIYYRTTDKDWVKKLIKKSWLELKGLADNNPEKLSELATKTRDQLDNNNYILLEDLKNINEDLTDLHDFHPELKPQENEVFYKIFNGDLPLAKYFNSKWTPQIELMNFWSWLEDANSRFSFNKELYLRLFILEAIIKHYDNLKVIGETESIPKDCINQVLGGLDEDASESIDYFMREDRYKRFHQLLNSYNQEDAADLIDEEMIFSIGRGLSAFHKSKKAFVKAFNKWIQRKTQPK